MSDENKGADNPAEAQQDGQDQANQIPGQLAFEHPAVKRRLSELSAKAREAEAYKAELARYQTQLQQYQQQSAQPQGDNSNVDPEDRQYFEQTVINPLYQRIMGDLAPVIDTTQRNAFWSQFPNEDPDVVQDTESMVAQLRAKGQHQVDRNVVRQLVLGQRYDAQRQAAIEQSASSQEQMAQVNNVAKTAQGATVQPEQNQEPDFDDLDNDEMFKRLSQSGTISKTFGSGGSGF